MNLATSKPRGRPSGRRASTGGSTGGSTPRGVSVFVRIRPLTPREREKGFSHLDGLALDGDEGAGGSPGVALEREHTRIDAFTGVFGTRASNREVFARAFAPRLGAVLNGGAASLFCFGYTGGGKTHTAIGYGEEKGLFFLAALRLLEDLHDLNRGGGRGGDDDMFLRATACEIYNDHVYDLLGDEKLLCTLRTDQGGRLVVQGPATREQLDQVAAASKEEVIPGFLLPGGKPSKQHATITTRSEGLRSTEVRRVDDLQEINHSCVMQRASGSSTEHHQSSRSHAILRLSLIHI